MRQVYNPFSLEGKNYLVTGAASGIGRETSVVLSRLGANLILVDINLEGLLKTQIDCQLTDKVLELDLTNSGSISEKVLSILPEFGKLHGFVHVAGKPYISPLKAVSEKKCAEIYALNTYAGIELARVFTNKNVYTGDKGSVVFISSVFAIVGSPANVGYAMSKSALHGITKALSIELAPKGIRVNCIAPGFVKTNMMNDTKGLFEENHIELLNKLHPLGLGKAEDVAFSIAYLLSDAAKWVTGAILNVDGGFTAQ
jgi:NAD(P)-dependent dehydrogenase (short-subunit alcohol dehydrogenase family)